MLPPDVTARIAVEQASTFGWERYVGRRSGRIIGMKTFGASAPLKELLRKFGFEPERVTEIAKELVGKEQEELNAVRRGVPARSRIQGMAMIQNAGCRVPVRC